MNQNYVLPLPSDHYWKLFRLQNQTVDLPIQKKFQPFRLLMLGMFILMHGNLEYIKVNTIQHTFCCIIWRMIDIQQIIYPFWWASGVQFLSIFAAYGLRGKARRSISTNVRLDQKCLFVLGKNVLLFRFVGIQTTALLVTLWISCGHTARNKHADYLFEFQLSITLAVIWISRTVAGPKNRMWLKSLW